MKKHKKGIRVLSVFFMLVTVICFTLSGCSLFSNKAVTDVSFNESEITLTVEQAKTISLSDITITPALAKDKDFTVSTSDNTIVSVSGKRIKAEKVGEATITVTTVSGNKTADCLVKILPKIPKSVVIAYDGDLIQDADSLSIINFMANFEAISAPDQIVKWKITDWQNASLLKNEYGATVDYTEIEASTQLPFLPSQCGKFKVEASIKNILDEKFEDSLFVSVFNPYISEPVFSHLSGTLMQEEGQYGNVNFRVDYEDDPQNPERVIEWFVNGVVKSTARAFTFNASSAGEYEIVLKINNKFIGSQKVTLKGQIVPVGLRVDYDNCYPQIMLYWSDTADGMGYQVEIRDASTNNVINQYDISTNHGTSGSYFNGSSVNLAEIIGADKPKNMFNTKFNIRVKSLGNGGAFTESAYSQAITTSLISTPAKEYLAKKYYGTTETNGYKNYYMYDEAELADIMAYFFLWRSTPKLNSGASDTKSYSLYINNWGADTEAELKEQVENAYSMPHFTGLGGFSFTLQNNILSLTVSYTTDSLPTKSTSGASNKTKGGLGATRPHIKYGLQTLRTTLPIESRPMEVTVENSEQLYYVAQLGYRPMPKAGSDAEKIYNYAKTVLVNIIDNTMTDTEKAHAIYDWVMWKTTYDYRVLDVKALSESVKYTSYYLEGILSDSKFSDGKSYAVCDAIAKAYSIMCNMEGIECIRVAGEAFVGYWGGHAWNKVKIDGGWYIVDATWGDESMSFSNNIYEMAFHRYLFLTDAEVSADHKEDSPNNYPRTAINPYNWYNTKFEFGEETLDFYIDTVAGSVNTEVEKLVEFMVDAKEGDNPMYKKEYMVGKSQSICYYIAFDIKIHKSLETLFRTANPVAAAFSNLAYRENSDYYTSLNKQGDYLYMFIFIAK